MANSSGAVQKLETHVQNAWRNTPRNLDENIVQTLDTQTENVKIVENQLQRNIKPGYKDAAEKRNSTRPARRNGAAESPRNHKQRQRQERERCKQVLVVTSTSLQNLFRYSR